ncbi:S8 family peptidase [Paenibacillus sacheonensis]|uniref:S8 family serine peptidase n=1 Tax=Paenibacillus sacheonensis TaxID=742054 RepID=A0A7X4YTE7_9BACL|nr:S8 family peptidase [Paenibacillus sacheonensis]MBM7567656.1 subtilisin family serine protease [Paenibacillus sacheonensis]NBC71241.1 S8 family serine peptidase [Paenibacillus sacheonensis]
MDRSAILRLLHSATSPSASAAKRRIVRFWHHSDYERFLLEWSNFDMPSEDASEAVRHLPSIEAFSLPVTSELLAIAPANGIWMENDPCVSVHATVHKPVAREKGIPWGVQEIKAPLAWSTTTGHRVKVGVIDTGVDFSHPDLKQSLGRGINLLNRGSLPHDDNGHGTHIAGTIAAANQLHGMIGVAPRATVHPVKAFDHNGSAFVSDIVLGIDWCVRSGMDIVNMSFGMKTRSKSLLTAVNNAYNAGVIIVASSGNDGKRKSIDYPARYPQTIAVGATNRLRRIAPFSNRGMHIDVYAPGDKILSSWLRGKYNEMSGTSMATSHVSGAIALLLAHRPGLTPTDIKAVVKRSMLPLRGTKTPRLTGELDVLRMLQAVER